MKPACLFSLLLVGVAGAAIAGDAAPVDSVVVSAERTSIGAFPYPKLYEAAKQIAVATKGRAALSLLMAPARDGIAMDDLRVTLSDSSEDIPVPLRAHQLMRVPVVDSMAERGELVVNKPKGSIKGAIAIVPLVEDSEWTIGLIKTAIHDYNGALYALKPILPWYARPFLHETRAIAFCAKSRGASVELEDKGGVIARFSTDEKDKNDLLQDVYCHSVSASTNYPDSARIRLGDGVEAMFN
jgi:hypothetical protein